MLSDLTAESWRRKKAMKQFYHDEYLFEVNIGILQRNNNICFVQDRGNNSWIKLKMIEFNGKLQCEVGVKIEGEPPEGALEARPVI